MVETEEVTLLFYVPEQEGIDIMKHRQPLLVSITADRRPCYVTGPIGKFAGTTKLENTKSEPKLSTNTVSLSMSFRAVSFEKRTRRRYYARASIH